MKTLINWILGCCFLLGSAFGQDDFFEPRTTIGGYGELHYNKSITGDEDPAKKLDFHRFIIFYSHAWTEEWSFKSEVELEHNFVQGGQGELELEQAYVNYHTDLFGFQAGVILPSVGFINEYHEPPFFLSVERPEYAKFIIPTTWFGNGFAVYGKISDFNWRAVIMEGLDGDKIINNWKNGIRDGRQKGYESDAEELLYNFNVDYTGVPGIRIGASFSKTTALVTLEEKDNIEIQLGEFHGKYDKNNIVAVFEWGNINYKNHVVDKSSGYYLDLGYNLGSFLNLRGKLIPWIRLTDINPAAGHDLEDSRHYAKTMFGLTFKPIDKVAFKLDYAIKTPLEKGADQITLINLGVGYQF